MGERERDLKHDCDKNLVTLFFGPCYWGYVLGLLYSLGG